MINFEEKRGIYYSTYDSNYDQITRKFKILKILRDRKFLERGKFTMNLLRIYYLTEL